MNVAPQPATPRARHRLEPGDRLPEFMLPDHTGVVRGFYQRTLGLGMAVFLDSDDALRQSLRDLAEAYQAARLDCLTIDATAQYADSSLCILADEAGRIRQVLRELSGHSSGPASGGAIGFLLDRNQRILAVSDEADLARWALTRWSAEPPPPVGEICHAAPVLTIPNILSRADCRALIARWHEMGHEPGAVTSTVKGEVVHRVYEDLKKRRDHRLDDPAVRKPLMAMVARRLGPELGKAFCYGSFKFDRVLIACYDSDRGDYFRRHRDNNTPTTTGRRFALTINLNSDEYEGGELMFPEYGDYRYKPAAGAAVVFSCSLLHEALPVTRGQRFALLSYLVFGVWSRAIVGDRSMRFARIINAVIWAWLALSNALAPVVNGGDFWVEKGKQFVQIGPIDDVPKLLGRAVVPFLFWLLIDWAIRRKRNGRGRGTAQ